MLKYILIEFKYYNHKKKELIPMYIGQHLSALLYFLLSTD